MRALLIIFLFLTTVIQGAASDITNEPLQTLHHMRAVKKDFVKKLEQFVPTSDIRSDWNYHVALARKFEQRNPLFLLDECPNDDSDSCVLNRTIFPRYRQAFEDAVVNKIVQLKKSEIDPVHYISFGSGGLFQDLAVIHKLLAKKPALSLAMHIIDIEYIPCVDMHDDLGGNREIVQELVEHPLVTARASCNEVTHRTIMRGLCIEFMCKQFIGHLKKSFTQAQLSLNVYKDGNDYIKHIEQHNTPCADIVVGADVEDPQDEAIQDLALLCKLVTRKNPHAQNVLLAKNDYTLTVDLVTFHAAPAADRKPFYFDDGSCMYRSFEVISERR